MEAIRVGAHTHTHTDNVCGIPIGNLTSQLFANIYLNELDQFIKHELKVRYYIRYTDDFVILSQDYEYLIELIGKIALFLEEELKLDLHPRKVTIRKYTQGVDFLGYIVFPHHTLLRTKTKRRILRKLQQKVGEYNEGLMSRESLEQTFQSYSGVLSHANAFELERKIKNTFWFQAKK